MQLGHILLIGGKDLTLPKYGSDLLGKHFYVEVFNFCRTHVEIKSRITRVKRIFIIHKEQDDEFRRRWPEIYAEKKPTCMNIPSNAPMDVMKKQLEKELMCYLREVVEEVMRR
jgi:hypothetical protein